MKGGGTDLDFEEYAQARVVRLRQRAYLLCRDWHLAQDLTQITLSRLYASWRKVVKADNIVVLDSGRLVAQGRHQSLLEGSELYARWASLQFDNPSNTPDGGVVVASGLH